MNIGGRIGNQMAKVIKIWGVDTIFEGFYVDWVVID